MLLIDRFYEKLPALRASGWVFESVSRYDPTVVSGLTPGGRTFTFTLTRAGAFSVSVGARLLSGQVAADLIEDADGTLAVLIDQWTMLPANQQ